MAIQALINCFICDTYAEVQSLPTQIGLAFCKEAGKQCFYFNAGGAWTRVAGSFTSIDAATPLSVTSGILGFDSSQFATASQGGKADSALQSGAAFATSAQGTKADSALQSASLNHIVSGHVDWLRVFIDKVTTTNATPQTIWTSDIIPVQSVVYLEGIIICDNPALAGSSVMTIISVSERQTGGSLLSTQADQVNTVGTIGNINVAAVEDPISNTIMLKVTGKLATTLNFYGRLEVLRSTA